MVRDFPGAATELVGAAGYRFGNYRKLDSVVMVVFFVVGVFLIPVFFPL